MIVPPVATVDIHVELTNQIHIQIKFNSKLPSMAEISKFVTHEMAVSKIIILI